jgi:hypothetical protein
VSRQGKAIDVVSFKVSDDLGKIAVVLVLKLASVSFSPLLARSHFVNHFKSRVKICFPCRFDAVVHFAALKAVGESIEKPLEYYKNNIGSAISLLESMRTTDCRVCFEGIATVMASVHSRNLPAVSTQEERILQLVYGTAVHGDEVSTYVYPSVKFASKVARFSLCGMCNTDNCLTWEVQEQACFCLHAGFVGYVVLLLLGISPRRCENHERFGKVQ